MTNKGDWTLKASCTVMNFKTHIPLLVQFAWNQWGRPWKFWYKLSISHNSSLTIVWSRGQFIQPEESSEAGFSEMCPFILMWEFEGLYSCHGGGRTSCIPKISLFWRKNKPRRLLFDHQLQFAAYQTSEIVLWTVVWMEPKWWRKRWKMLYLLES